MPTTSGEITPLSDGAGDDEADEPGTETGEDGMFCAVPGARKARAECGARTRNGGVCRQRPLTGRNRCKLHGGMSPRGEASPHFKTGYYSRAVPKGIRADFNKLLRDPELLEARAEVALLQVRLVELSKRVTTNESGNSWRELARVFDEFTQANNEGNQPGMLAALNRLNVIITGAVNNEAAWSELTEYIDKVTRVSEREWKRALASQHVATAEQVRAIVASLVNAVMLYVPDTQARLKIAEHVNRLRIIEPVKPDDPTSAEADGGS